MIRFLQIPPAMIGAIGPLILTRLESIVSRSSGRASIEDIVRRVLAEEWYLWVAMDDETKEVLAILAAELKLAPTGMKIASVVAATGDDRKRWRDGFLECIEGWARDNGCGLVEIVARPGWERELQSYKKTHVVLERALS